MVRVGVVVEGHTEMDFVELVLAPYFFNKGIIFHPKRIGSRDGVEGGGHVTVQRLTVDMAELYWSCQVVTSLVDFYGFRDKENMDVEQLEMCIMTEIGNRIGSRFDERKSIPYVQRHEFESLLFSDLDAFSAAIGAKEEGVARLSTSVRNISCPEDINDGPNTFPSNRIIEAIHGYDKRTHGPRIAAHIGIDAIRSKCPRFNEWLKQLEALGS